MTETFYVCACIVSRVPAVPVEEVREFRPIVEVDGNVTTWTCPLCGTRILTAIDGGTLDLGLVRDEDLRPGDFEVLG